MRTETARIAGSPARWLLGTALVVMAACAPQRLPAAEEAAPKLGADWDSWRADTNVSDLASVQRGARNFVSYCLGCHSLKYERWSRLGADLRIPPDLLARDLMPAPSPPITSRARCRPPTARPGSARRRRICR
jgi:cytochrome c1